MRTVNIKKLVYTSHHYHHLIDPPNHIQNRFCMRRGRKQKAVRVKTCEVLSKTTAPNQLTQYRHKNNSRRVHTRLHEREQKESGQRRIGNNMGHMQPRNSRNDGVRVWERSTFLGGCTLYIHIHSTQLFFFSFSFSVFHFRIFIHWLIHWLIVWFIYRRSELLYTTRLV